MTIERFSGMDNLWDITDGSSYGETGQAEPSGEACPSAVTTPTLLGVVPRQREDFRTKSGEIGVHWLQGTIPHNKVAAVVRYLSEVFEVEPELQGFGRYRYNRSYTFEPFNVTVYFDTDYEVCKKRHKGRACVSITGSALDTLDADTLFSLVKTLVYDYWFLGTRIDLFFDDYKKRVSIDEIIEAAEKGNITGYRNYEPFAGRRKISYDGEEHHAEGVGFGTRGKQGGGKYTRCYDKEKETNGLQKCNRFETEFVKEFGQKVVFALACCDDVELFAGKIGGYIASNIKFIDRSSSTNVSRCQMLDWWYSIITELYAGDLKLRNEKKEDSVEKSQNWISTSVSATLGMLRLAKGEDEFYEWLEHEIYGGIERLSKRQRKMIRVYNQQREDAIPI